MRLKMSKSARQELSDCYRKAYIGARRHRKSEILNAFVEATGYNRKYASRLLSGKEPPQPPGPRKRHRRFTYTGATLRALERVWNLSDRLCAKRLVPFLAAFLPKLESAGAITLTDHTRSQLLTISAATADRHLSTVRRTLDRRGLSATKPGALLKSQIPVRTFADWQDALPGFTEVDVVVHTDDLAGGHYLSSLVLTDVATAWTECRPLLRHDATSVCAALEDIRRSLPFSLRGINSDNGSEFINRLVVDFCNRRGITFTRGRPYRKNDQARVEQKNGHIVRSLVGYDRFSGRRAYQRLKGLYECSNPWVNLFQPSQRLLEKHREGARVQKKYDAAATPCQRVLASPDVSEENKQALRAIYDAADPVALLKQLKGAQKHLFELANTRSESYISK